MTRGVNTIIYPVKDITKAKAIFARLTGIKPAMDEPYYVQFNVDGQQIGLDPNGHAQGATGPINYWHVDDIRKSMSALIDAGARKLQEIKDVGGGKLIGSVTDADGNVIALLQNP
jgi:predicted enzyme related to lactoylglutathione lyase